MAAMPLRAKRGFLEWFGLVLVAMTLLSIPSIVRDSIAMVRETHWTWVFIPVCVGLGYGWNSYWVKRWWNPEAHKIKWHESVDSK
jgi:hypothetical protein